MTDWAEEKADEIGDLLIHRMAEKWSATEQQERLSKVAAILRQAEARGYARGIEEAARVADDEAESGKHLGNARARRMSRLSVSVGRRLATRIRALKDGGTDGG